jgi:hypothetical protein
MYETEFGVIGKCSGSDTGSELGQIICFLYTESAGLSSLVHSCSGSQMAVDIHLGAHRTFRVTSSDSGDTAKSVSRRWS